MIRCQGSNVSLEEKNLKCAIRDDSSVVKQLRYVPWHNKKLQKYLKW